MPDAIIELNSLVKTYDTGEVQVQALRGVDLTVERGEMVAIMGPSGCGKTTLLNTASGLDDPTEGSITIEGTDLGSLDDNTKGNSELGAERGPSGDLGTFSRLMVRNVVWSGLPSGSASAVWRLLRDSGHTDPVSDSKLALRSNDVGQSQQ